MEDTMEIQVERSHAKDAVLFLLIFAVACGACVWIGEVYALIGAVILMVLIEFLDERLLESSVVLHAEFGEREMLLVKNKINK